jgi:hypothetical protein
MEKDNALPISRASTGEKCRIYVAFSDLHEQSVTGEFNYFDLSKTAIVPWF